VADAEHSGTTEVQARLLAARLALWLAAAVLAVWQVAVALTNQYAAMPSLHFGWSLWCGAVIAVIAPKWWMKGLGLLHPFFTASAIVATGNHWVLDAVGGAVVAAGGFGLSYLLQGPRARTVAAAAEADAEERAPVHSAQRP
jgi:membrane-associated phospholipid phosphatase